MGGSQIQHTNGSVETQDGLTLFCQAWKEQGLDRAALAIIHGYGDHGGRYDRLARHLVTLGLSVYAVDLRGHGRSPGKRGHISRFEEYLRDTDALLQHVRRSEPGLPILLLGHSLGGLIAARFAEEQQPKLAGLVLSSPFLRIKMAVPVWKRAAASILSLTIPSLTMASDLNVHWLTHDPEIISETIRDPLVYRIATPRWFTEVQRAQAQATGAAGRIRQPVLLQYAGDDKIADACETDRFLEQLSCPVTVHRYAGLYHEIYNEIERESVFTDLERWIETLL